MQKSGFEMKNRMFSATDFGNPFGTGRLVTGYEPLASYAVDRAWGVSGHGNHRVFKGLQTGQFCPFWWPVSEWKGPCFPVVRSPAER